MPVIGEEIPSATTHSQSSQAVGTAQVASASAASSSNTEWKKPKFQKKKRFGAKNQKNQQEAVSQAATGQTQPALAKKKPAAIKTQNLDPPRNEKLDRHELNRQMYRQAQNKRTAEV